MNRMQYLLGKLAEEASEIAQIALKTQQFGVHELCPGLEETNIERVNKEFNDLLGVVELINDEFGKERWLFPLTYNDDLVRAKLDKIEKYYQYSIQCGQVEVSE